MGLSDDFFIIFGDYNRVSRHRYIILGDGQNINTG